jgi:hypothetical protein
MDPSERFVVVGDIVIAAIIAALLWIGLVPSSSILSSISYVLIAAFVSLTVWGFRMRIQTSLGRPTGSGGVTRTSIETHSEKILVNNDKIVLPPKSYESYSAPMVRSDRMTGTIASDIPIDIYVMKDTAFHRWDNGGNPEMELIREGVKRHALDFRPRHFGEWYLVLENNSREKAEIDVFVKVSYGKPGKT